MALRCEPQAAELSIDRGRTARGEELKSTVLRAFGSGSGTTSRRNDVPVGHCATLPRGEWVYCRPAVPPAPGALPGRSSDLDVRPLRRVFRQHVPSGTPCGSGCSTPLRMLRVPGFRAGSHAGALCIACSMIARLETRVERNRRSVGDAAVLCLLKHPRKYPLTSV
jgi:hypothetical protein